MPRGAHRRGAVPVPARAGVPACRDAVVEWDYPHHFYATRMSRDWPTLQFICAINEDMGSFGGIVARIDGKYTDLVADYDLSYDRRAHRRQMRKVQTRWGGVVEGDRPWRVDVPLKYPVADLQGRRDARHHPHEPALPQRRRRAEVRDGAEARDRAEAERADGKGAAGRCAVQGVTVASSRTRSASSAHPSAVRPLPEQPSPRGRLCRTFRS